MKRNIPNLLTIARVLLAGVFFVLLGLYQRGSSSAAALLNAAFIIYLVAGVTDVLDGYLARKWQATSAFGRMIDPIVDKVLVVGAFAMLAGANFAMGAGQADGLDGSLPFWLTGGMFSGVQAWMVVVILSREFIVSGLRGYSESQGVKFPATPAGKLKMFLQSLAICATMFQLANMPHATWAIVLKLSAVWASVVATVLSGLVYVRQARSLLRDAVK